MLILDLLIDVHDLLLVLISDTECKVAITVIVTLLQGCAASC